MAVALILMLAWAAYGLIGPVVLRNRKTGSGYHNALAVWMAPRDWPGDVHWSGTYWPALRVQEAGEWRLCKLIGLAAAMPGLMLAQGEPVMVHILLTVMPMLLVDGFSRLLPGVDYAGHGAEIMVAEAAGFADYRAQEIERMRMWDGRMEMSAAQVDAALRRWHWLALVVRVLGRW